MVSIRENSRKTSVKQVPAMFKKIVWVPGLRNLDIGGGKYDEGTAYLAEQGVYNMVYDPYNRSQEHNDRVMEEVTKNKVDTVTLANVLNVIESNVDRNFALEVAWAALKPGGACFVSVYEGDKSGVAKVTSTGSYQRNLRTKEYFSEVSRAFGFKNTCYLGSKIIMAWKGERS